MRLLEQDRVSREALTDDNPAMWWHRICVALIVVTALIILFKVGAMIVRPLQTLDRAYQSPVTETGLPQGRGFPSMS